MRLCLHGFEFFTNAVTIVKDFENKIYDIVMTYKSINHQTHFSAQNGTLIIEDTNLVSRSNLFTVGRPEPTQEVLGFEVLTSFASFEIAKTARGPDVRNIVCK